MYIENPPLKLADFLFKYCKKTINAYFSFNFPLYFALNNSNLGIETFCT